VTPTCQRGMKKEKKKNYKEVACRGLLSAYIYKRVVRALQNHLSAEFLVDYLKTKQNKKKQARIHLLTSDDNNLSLDINQ